MRISSTKRVRTTAWTPTNGNRYPRKNILGFLGENRVAKTALPKGLSIEARRLFRQTCEQYAIDDAPSLVLLGNAYRALDRLREAEGKVKAEGAVYADRFGQPKAHPAARRAWTLKT